MAQITYEEFVKKMKEELERILPEGYTLEYPNMSLKAENPVTLVKEGYDARPTIYLTKDSYNYWQEKGASIGYVAREILNSLEEAYKHVQNFNSMEVLTQTCGIIPCLMKKEGNESLLAEIPHRMFHGMVLYYRKIIDGLGSVVIKNEFLKFDLIPYSSEEDLFTIASLNMRDLKVEAFGPIIPLVAHLGNENEWGANIMLFPEKLKKLAEICSTNMLYFLPLTCDDIFILPDESEVSAIKETVEAIKTNMPEMFLTETIFCFNTETKEISVVENLEKEDW